MTVGLPLGFEPRQQRSIDARDRLFDEAMRLFGDHGVEQTRVEDIVAAADVSWGTFFRYFPRKEDVLLHAARLELARRLVPLVDHGVAENTQAKDLALAFFTELLSPSGFTPRAHGAIIRESVARHERYLAVLRDTPPTFELVRRIVEVGQKQGAVRDDERADLLAGVLACATIYPTLYGFYDVAAQHSSLLASSPAPMVRRYFDIAWRGLEPTADS